MPGLNIEERKIVEIKGTSGHIIRPGDILLIRKGGEDIFCRFHILNGGYFVTETVDGKHKNKYRVASIERCEILSEIISKYGAEAAKENKEES